MLKAYILAVALCVLPLSASAASAIFEAPAAPAVGNEVSPEEFVMDSMEAANRGLEVIFPYVSHNVYKVYTQEGFVTDIRLEPGEKIKYIGGGDTVRWRIDTAESGGYGNVVSHVIVKPLQPAISTNIIINTDRRVYQVILVSGHLHNSMVSWLVPKPMAEAQGNNGVVSYAKINPVALDFRYKVSDKNFKWSPEKVFRSSNKTYFKMKPDIVNTELPTFFSLDDEGNKVLVSFRYKNGYFIVDRLIDKGVFLLGKSKVFVTYKG